MNAAAIFSVANAAVVPAWLLLAIVPRWTWSQRIATFVVPVALAVLYLVALLNVPATPGGNFTSLDGVTRFFTQPFAVLAGWLHYLAFDLFVGSWQTRDARRLGINHGFVVPALVLTFLAGPLGLGGYLLLRLAVRRRFGTTLGEEAAS